MTVVYQILWVVAVLNGGYDVYMTYVLIHIPIPITYYLYVYIIYNYLYTYSAEMTDV